MNFEELNEWFGILFEKGKKEEIRAKLAKFKEDEWLLQKLGARFDGKDLKNMSIDDFVPTVAILETVILPEYPIEDVVKYSPLYVPTIGHENTYQAYKHVLAHLNQIKNIEPSLVSNGIIKNPDFRISSSSSMNNPKLYIFEESSYLSIIERLLDNHPNAFPPERLAKFNTHFQDLKTKGIDLTKLFDCGYAEILRRLNDGDLRREKFPTTSLQVAGLLKKLNTDGFDIYHKSSMSKLAGRINDDGIRELSIVSEYLSKEAMMYLGEFHLKE